MHLYPVTQSVATVSHGSAAEPTPAEFDPAAYPIIAQHWFGIEPPCAIGSIAAEVVANPHFRRQVEYLHQLGPRATAELLAEIGAERGITTIIERKIEKYAALDTDALELVGGDQFPALPIHVVRS